MAVRGSRHVRMQSQAYPTLLQRPQNYVSVSQAPTQRASDPGSCASVSQYVSCGQEAMTGIGRQLLQQVLRLDDHGEVPQKAEVVPEKVPQNAEVVAEKVPQNAEVVAEKVPKKTKVTKEKVPQNAEVVAEKVPQNAEVVAEKVPKNTKVTKEKVQAALPAGEVRFTIRARFQVVSLVEAGYCRYVANLLTTRPPEGPVNLRYQVVSEDGVQEMGERLISFSPEGEAKLCFTLKDTASGELDLAIFVPGQGTARWRFERYSRAEREAARAAYRKASSSSSRPSAASTEGSNSRRKAFDARRSFRITAKKFFGIDVACWEGMAYMVAEKAGRKYCGFLPCYWY